MKSTIFNEPCYDLYVYNVESFKTSCIDFVFSIPFSKDNLGYISFLKKVLGLVSKDYPYRKDVVKEFEKLYNIRIGASLNKSINSITLTLSLGTINDTYTKKNNMYEAVILLFKLINHPLVKKGEFDERIFRIIKKELKDDLLRHDEDINRVSYEKLIKHIDPNSTHALKLVGDKETINKLNASKMATYYEEFFKRASVKIFAVGEYDANKLNDIIKKYHQFKANPFYKYQKQGLNIDPKLSLKIIDQGNFKQSKLYTFIQIDNVSDLELCTVGRVFNEIFGHGTLSNKLFKKVREENSLCYHISSNMQYYINAFVVGAGIKKSNFDKTIKLIKECLVEMQEGKFSETDVEEAKKLLDFSYEMNYDSVESICNMMQNEPVYNEPTLDDIKLKTREVTKKDIIAFANHLTIVTNYMLAEEENE
ncbi:MAG: insulinase family protein [Bacilli bacterium]|nr:insulinase family protein [Bacilli bacterium]